MPIQNYVALKLRANSATKETSISLSFIRPNRPVSMCQCTSQRCASTAKMALWLGILSQLAAPTFATTMSSKKSRSNSLDPSLPANIRIWPRLAQLWRFSSSRSQCKCPSLARISATSTNCTSRRNTRSLSTFSAVAILICQLLSISLFQMDTPQTRTACIIGTCKETNTCKLSTKSEEFSNTTTLIRWLIFLALEVELHLTERGQLIVLLWMVISLTRESMTFQLLWITTSTALTIKM